MHHNMEKKRKFRGENDIYGQVYRERPRKYDFAVTNFREEIHEIAKFSTLNQIAILTETHPIELHRCQL